MWSRDSGQGILGVSKGVIAFIANFKPFRNTDRHSRILKSSATPFWWFQISNNIMRCSIINLSTVDPEAQKHSVIRDTGQA